MKAVQVFCGSRRGTNPEYAQAARNLGFLMAEKGLTLVFGGGHVGLMGIIADAVLEAGGQAVGVIPDFLQEKELGHQHLTHLHVVGSMHERKLKMASLSDATIALAGSFGTLDELFEILTLVQLGRFHQPVGPLNTLGFFDHLLGQLDRMESEGFLKDIHRNSLIADDNPERLIGKLQHYQTPAPEGKWDVVV